ncbi:MAG: hypothetical protein J7497_06165 [Chitinophagaceae bacterium]|nr:hypothetical protein [Chitinophagaceae bacterium]
MNDLIEKLKLSVGITDEQAVKAIEVIKNYTKEKFPMFAGAIDELFSKYGGEEEDPLD